MRLRSFTFAFAGWRYVMRTQHNTWIHALASVLVIALSLWLGLRPLELAMIFVAITLVWMAEFLNTALEAVVDLASPQKHPLAKIGKDVGAAAVLLAAIASVLIGLLVLGPSLWARISQLF